MIKLSAWSSHEEALLLVNAYLDGELDASAVLEVERRLKTDANLRAEYDRLLGLRTTIASRLAKDRASDALRSPTAPTPPGQCRRSGAVTTSQAPGARRPKRL